MPLTEVERTARAMSRLDRVAYLRQCGWVRKSTRGSQSWESPDGSECLSMGIAVRAALAVGKVPVLNGGEAATPVLGQPRRLIAAGPPDRPAAVYRIYNTDGEIIYVGVGYDPWKRLQGHLARASWAGSIHSYAADWFPSRALADQVEQALIRQERPIYNVQGTDLHRLVSTGRRIPTSCGDISSYAAR